ncbi:hypothetical protein UFOVP1071_99 [uncultured Caudovirales phage]|uniref:Uncharacterized protein n=1 Tax=uncultured Caudovirales phage TaxID=2100421 RepID=A0A6J5QHU8_9CAUD|nr:hypothetical protein UFOVP1071_99 [uncultured Caudovirales phage]
MHEKLSDDNFLIYCAKHYDNPQCHSTEEFIEDLKRIKYIKKLITRYIDSGELKDRLILNHLIILYNVFGAEHMARILYLKMRVQFSYIKPFLILLGVLPEKIYNIRDEAVINTDSIQMDAVIVQALRKV